MAGGRGANHGDGSRYGTIRLVSHLHRCPGSPPSRHQQRRGRRREAARHPRRELQHHVRHRQSVELRSGRRPVLPVRRLRRPNNAQRYLDVIADTYSFRHGFAGGKADSITGRVHFRNRDYDTYLARWISRDPIGYEGSEWNLYSYTSNNPIVRTDPSGLDWGAGDWLDRNFGGGGWGRPDTSGDVIACLFDVCSLAPIAGEVGDSAQVILEIDINGNSLSNKDRVVTVCAMAIPVIPGRPLRECLSKVEDSCKTAVSKRRAIQEAQDHAQVPRVSKGGEVILIDELNASSRGKNVAEIMRQGGGNLGRRNPIGKEKIFDHPDGHPDAGQPGVPSHHDHPHVHATNRIGEEIIIIYPPVSGR